MRPLPLRLFSTRQPQQHPNGISFLSRSLQKGFDTLTFWPTYTEIASVSELKGSIISYTRRTPSGARGAATPSYSSWPGKPLLETSSSENEPTNGPKLNLISGSSSCWPHLLLLLVSLPTSCPFNTSSESVLHGQSYSQK